MKRCVVVLLMQQPLDILYQQYARDLYCYARERVSSADAEDLVQTLFLNICELDARENETRRTRGYYFVALRHLLNSFQRKRDNLPSLLSLEELEDHLVDCSAEHDGEQQPLQRLEDIVHHLPPSWRDILLLRYHEGLSYHEIAQRLGLGYQQVKYRAFRGLSLLKRKREVISPKLH